MQQLLRAKGRELVFNLEGARARVPCLKCASPSVTLEMRKPMQAHTGACRTDRRRLESMFTTGEGGFPPASTSQAASPARRQNEPVKSQTAAGAHSMQRQHQRQSQELQQLNSDSPEAIGGAACAHKQLQRQRLSA